MKGIILAGGLGTRLYPLTQMTSKQLLPVYDKPMVYYPLSVLMLSEIHEVLIITTEQELGQYQTLLGDGSHLGISIEYAIQEEPRGIADAFLVGESFIGDDSVCLILGDNIFYGESLPALIKSHKKLKEGAVVFAYYVKDPGRYGVLEFDGQTPVSIHEKPQNPPSSWAVTGLYMYDNRVVEMAKGLKPSARGELEITSINNLYMQEETLHVEKLGRGMAWLDTGTHASLLDASQFVHVIETRQDLKIACLEEIAYRTGRISADQLKLQVESMGASEYGQYLQHFIQREGI